MHTTDVDIGRPAGSLTLPRIAVVAVAAYAGAQVISDVSSLKIGIVAGRSVDMGTFLYPITFTLRDVVHKLLGRDAARTLIFTAAVINLAMAAYFAWTASISSDPAWGLGGEYEAILGPVWRIVIASIVAEVVSQLIDTEVYQWFVTRVTTGHQWARVLVSNSVSVPVDSVVFAVLAFAPLPLLGDHPLSLTWGGVWDIIAVNVVIKYAVTLVSLPLIYVAPDRAGRTGSFESSS
jgi:queuosine precursor transporter